MGSAIGSSHSGASHRTPRSASRRRRPLMEPLLVLRGVTKRYGGVQALAGADLDVRAGEVHGLVGENGAGKSTLLKILSGAVIPDSGEIRIAGAPLPTG